MKLLDLFPPKEGVDPQVFQVAIASVLTHYPLDVISIIADPFEGLPSRQPWSPSPFDVKKFCDEKMQIMWSKAERARRIGTQSEAPVDRTGRPTLREIEDEMAARGFYMTGYMARERRAAVMTEREFEVEMKMKRGLPRGTKSGAGPT